MSATHVPARRQQQGIALVVVLVMLLLVTGLGIAAVRTLILQERMAANSFDRNLAMQSAERALRIAESIALAQRRSPVTPNPGFPADPAGLLNGNYAGSCVSPTGTDPSPCASGATGLCSRPSPTCAARWTDPAFDASWATVTSTVAGDPASPALESDSPLSLGLRQQYLIEFLGSNYPCSSNVGAAQNCFLYRITVRTNPSGDRSSVQLQTTFLAQ
ncbi:MAG: PilX N-terminal domain-containing pilus assembly protein [Rhodoferax sp.]